MHACSSPRISCQRNVELSEFIELVETATNDLPVLLGTDAIDKACSLYAIYQALLEDVTTLPYTTRAACVVNVVCFTCCQVRWFG